jgi:1-acyl-sn-glycerol-3-phosphate acyltransferase
MNLYRFGRAIVAAFLHLCFRIRIEGIEHIPKGQNFVVCSNHKSNLDPPVLGTAMPISLRFMAKEELFKNKLFGALLRALGAFPIRRGKSDVGALRSAVKMIQSGESVGIFPEGGRSKLKGQMRKGKSGAVLIALKAGVDILPVGICGEYKPFSKIIVRIGSPIAMETYRNEKIDGEELQRITDEELMPAIAALAEVKVHGS